MNQTKYQSRLKEYRIQIRRNQIDQMKRQFRMNAELDLTTIADVASSLRLPHRAYSIQQVMELCKKELQKPPLAKLVSESEEHLSILPIEAHIRFWRFYSQQLQQDSELWSPLAQEVLLRIIQDLPYQEAHHSVAYELHLLNTLQVAAPFMPWPAKSRILYWIAGPQGLRVIEACLDGRTFLKCNEYKRVYKVIELGLKSQLRQENEDAAAVLCRLLRLADWDDTYSIYSQIHGLAIYLCEKIERYAKDGCTRTFSQALILLMDTYDEAVLDYARSGVAFTAAQLIQSDHAAAKSEGLQILKMLSMVDDPKMCEFLLDNKDINACHMWERLCGSSDFAKSTNIELRQSYFSFLENLLAHCHQKEAEELSNRFSGPYQDIFDVLGDCLRQEDTPLILKSALNCIKSLCYYGQREDEDNLLLGLLESRGMLKEIDRLANANDQVGTLAAQILEALRSH